jgi:hypothetical protein
LLARASTEFRRCLSIIGAKPMHGWGSFQETLDGPYCVCFRNAVQQWVSCPNEIRGRKTTWKVSSCCTGRKWCRYKKTVFV